MLAYCVTRALQKGPHKDIRTLLKARLMDSMDIPESEWRCGYGQTTVVDGLPLVGTWGGGSFSVRATAAIIRLLMRQGAWGKDHLLRAHLVEDAFGLFDGEGIDVGLELFEGREDLGREDIGACRGELAELDEGGAEFFADFDKPGADGLEGVCFFRGVVGLVTAQEPGGCEIAAELEAVDEVSEAVLRENLGDDAEPGEGSNGFWQRCQRHGGVR